MMQWPSVEGSPVPLGASWVEQDQAFNFAIYSASAGSVRVLFFSEDALSHPVFTFDFDFRRNKTGPVWHARIPVSLLGDVRYYAYSMDGPQASSAAFPINAFRPNKLLLDPYATSVMFPPGFDRSAAYGEQANFGQAPLAVLPQAEEEFDWGSHPAPRHFGDLIIYEMHVRGFTMNPNSGVEAANRGTFQGVMDKIPYLQELGITAVELMPVYEFDDTEPNYWGYMPLNFFSPHHKFSREPSGCAQTLEFKRMVKALHEADIEVILDVVYNHTGEANETGPAFSFKGIDCQTYYMASRDGGSPFADYSGTGNTLNCSKRAVRQLIVDSLRYWVREMHVNGFRFDLASVFSRNSDGAINFDDPPIFGEIGADPVLGKVRLIAEPWEGNPKYPNYELGEGRGRPRFPGIGWRQWNDQFRNTVRRFVKSDSGTAADLATRLYGSADFFPDSIEESCRPYQSLNYVASHDGLTLYDLVAYTSADSWNCGSEGDADADDAIMALRKRQVKNFAALLMLSNGTPMFRAGDEFLQSQEGETNPYAIDGSLTWLDWNRLPLHADVFRFFSKMIGFRKQHTSIGRSTFWREDIRWFGVTGEADFGWDSHTLAYFLSGARESDKDLYVMINSFWKPLRFHIQQPGDWSRAVDTSLATPDDFQDEAAAPVLADTFYLVQPRSIVVLVS
jgi:isoamylase